MAGTKAGGQKAAAKNLQRDPEFYAKIGRKGPSTRCAFIKQYVPAAFCKRFSASTKYEAKSSHTHPLKLLKMGGLGRFW